jgi:hypothetical protein
MLFYKTAGLTGGFFLLSAVGLPVSGFRYLYPVKQRRDEKKIPESSPR